MTQDSDVKGIIVNCALSDKRGVPKESVQCVDLVENFGVRGDAHAGVGDRQVSISSLSTYSRGIARELGLRPGGYADNLTVDGVELYNMKVGTRLKAGESALLEIVEIGKKPHEHVKESPYPQFNRPHNQMLKEGVFCKVLKGGKVCVGDTVEVVRDV